MPSTNANGSQCVAIATCDAVGMDRAEVFRLAEGLGGGFGNFTQNCGALCGALLTISAANSDGIDKITSKPRTYELTREFTKRFDEACGGTTCAVLRPEGGSVPICEGYIKTGVRLTLEMLQEEGFIE